MAKAADWATSLSENIENLTLEEAKEALRKCLAALVGTPEKAKESGRVAARISIEELRAQIEPLLRASGGSYVHLSKLVEKDLSKVKFDNENENSEPYGEWRDVLGYRTLDNGLTVLGINAGGDWEWPISIFFYSDGKNVRAYIPKDGNTWNTKTKMAWGNADEDEDDEPQLDPVKLFQDLKDRVKVK